MERILLLKFNDCLDVAESGLRLRISPCAITSNLSFESWHPDSQYNRLGDGNKTIGIMCLLQRGAVILGKKHNELLNAYKQLKGE